MNENMSLEELRQQVFAIQQRIEEIEKESSQNQGKKTPWQLADVCSNAYFVNAYLDGTVGESIRTKEGDYNAFEQQSVAQGFANAFSVMIRLRQCEGAGMFDHIGSGWIIDYSGDVEWKEKDEACYSLFPPFPSYGEALAAAKSVGIDKIIAAYKFLASGE